MQHLACPSAFARDRWFADLRATLALGSPMVLTNLAQTALATTDMIVLGRLGAPALAAAALGINLYVGLLYFAVGVVTATLPLMATAIGRKQRVLHEVRRTFRQGLWSALIISVPCWIVLWNSRAVLLLFGQDAQLATDAQALVRCLQWGFLPALGFVALRSFVAALGRPAWALMVTAGAILFNIVANWALVFGHLGLPALGLRGSGLSTALSNVFLFASFAAVAVCQRRFRHYHLFGRLWRPDWTRLLALWRLGLPIGAALAFEVTVFSAAVFLMGWFGEVAVAAHAIAMQIAIATFMVPLGFGQAATVRVGRARGAGDRGAMIRAGWSAFGLAVGFMAMMSLTMVTAPRVLISAFIDIHDPANAAVVSAAVVFLSWAAVFQIADGAQVVGAGMLRGLQDTRVPMLYAAIGYWGIGMSLSLLLAFGLGFGGVGIWMGLAAGLVVVACAMIRRWITRTRRAPAPAA